MATYKGRFKPQNYEKYDGDPSNIVFRSGWEYKVMKWLDTHPDIISWSSEEFFIPYISPLDGKKHRYFPDFKATIRQEDGTFKTFIMEVKPLKQTIQPVPKNKAARVTKAYIREVTQYGVNAAKWEACYKYCNERKWDFQIITELDLFSNNGKKNAYLQKNL